MGKVNLYNDSGSAATTVPNTFIEKYMTHADGEYVKIYLYLLRCMNRADYDFSVARFAEHFEHTEKDILRALKYWEKVRLLRLEYDGDGNLSGICLLSHADEQACAQPSEADRFASPEGGDPLPDGRDPDDRADSPESGKRFIQAVVPRRTEYTPEELARFSEKGEVAEMLYVAEQYLGRTLSPDDLSHIFSWYDQMHFSAEFIEFLIESSVSRGHTNIYYIEKIAEDFASRGIRTVEEAREVFAHNSELYSTVMKAFGIRGRSLAASERDYITKWSEQMGFSAAMIGEACSRTIEQIHDPSFRYADKILQNWSSSGITSIGDVQNADRSRKAAADAQHKPAGSAKAKPKATGFTNYQERDNDYEELQRRLVLRSMQS